jgi:hypothetical protein
MALASCSAIVAKADSSCSSRSDPSRLKAWGFLIPYRDSKWLCRFAGGSSWNRGGASDNFKNAACQRPKKFA